MSGQLTMLGGAIGIVTSLAVSTSVATIGLVERSDG